MADDTTQVWGYSKDGAQLFDLKPGEKLPEGTFDSPASVPGSEAQKAYIADAEREGAPTPLVTEAPPAPSAKADKADKAADKADTDTKAGK
jgi:hypothetical protein